jgi:16S rRNA A1518/A1519 N6-dimethyltransferase RsmA/KsgA/DIM1 with predicted DNA glycosylase/AP lyase activity
MNRRKCKSRAEFGDFQTPEHLAQKVCQFLYKKGVKPTSIIEPTCGKGSFILAATEIFASIDECFAADIDNNYLKQLRDTASGLKVKKIEITNSDFFNINWPDVLSKLKEPLLIIGNPPWVTNSELGNIESNNLPPKSNFKNHKGLDAITGKSNFDISEWMLVRLISEIQNRNAVLAMLCKTTVARRVVKHIWLNDFCVKKVSMYEIDAKRYFNAAVDACLLLCEMGKGAKEKVCDVYTGISEDNRRYRLGFCKNELLADVEKYSCYSYLDGFEYYKWRSGIKHDCAKIMELFPCGNRLRNGLGEIVDIEKDLLYPLFKSSDIAKNDVESPKRWVLVTQKSISDETEHIRNNLPNTWVYLIRHAQRLDNRKSSIYHRRPRFSMFGVGNYAFAPWKVCISGLYKKIHFSTVGIYEGKPAMVDDTCYYISCFSEQEALFLANILNSGVNKNFMSSLIFWDSKRPITIDILRRIDFAALAEKLGKDEQLYYYLKKKETREAEKEKQLVLNF